MSSTHPVPLIVVDQNTNNRCVATAADVQELKSNHPMRYGRWQYANRQAAHRQFVSEGIDDKEAWFKAFELYPKVNNSRSNPNEIVS